MSRTLNALTVVLEHDMREENAEPLINAIRMLRGVVSVDTHVADMESHLAKTQAKHELRMKIFEVLN